MTIPVNRSKFVFTNHNEKHTVIQTHNKMQHTQVNESAI